MRPLLVTATMASAIVSEHDVHLDALLEYAVAKRELGELVLDRSAPREQIRHFDLPIRRWTGPGGESVWGASCWMLSDDAGLHPELTRITKRKSAEDVSQLARPWTPGAGPDRNRRVQKQAVCAASVSWWAFRDHVLETTPSARRERYEARFAKQSDDEHTAREQVRQLLMNDWENSVPTSSPRGANAAKIRRLYWDRL